MWFVLLRRRLLVPVTRRFQRAPRRARQTGTSAPNYSSFLELVKYSDMDGLTGELARAPDVGHNSGFNRWKKSIDFAGIVERASARSRMNTSSERTGAMLLPGRRCNSVIELIEC